MFRTINTDYIVLKLSALVSLIFVSVSLTFF